MKGLRPRSRAREASRRALRATAVLLTSATSAVLIAQQPQVFRSAADLIAVNVHVVAANGEPIARISADRFEVTIDGRRHRIVTADLVRVPDAGAQAAGPGRGETGPLRAGVADAPPAAPMGRMFVIVVDVPSLAADALADVRAAAQRFVATLPPGDRVGLSALPAGGSVEPTQERAVVRDTLEQIVGAADGPVTIGNRFQLPFSTLVDITAARQGEPSVPRRNPPANTTLGRLLNQVCAVVRDPDDCRQAMVAEAEKLALFEEGTALRRIAALRALLARLSSQPGPKSLVLISGGVPQTDRAGGRPDLGDIGVLVGKEAARAQATIYALHVDRPRSAPASSATAGRQPVEDQERDRAILTRPLDEIAVASGGILFRVVQGGGDPYFERIAAETSAHYRLGVEPLDADRGEPRRLTVKIAGLPRGATVRAREWVTMPRVAQTSTPASQPAAPPAPRRASIWDPVPPKQDAPASAPAPSAPPRRASIWDPPATKEPTAPEPAPAATPPPPPAVETEFDRLYAAYASGETSIVGLRLSTREDYERYRPDLLRTLTRWRTEWSPRRAAFALEVAMSAIARRWPNPRDFLASARAIVISRPDPPGRNVEDDRVEILFHRVAAAILASVDAPHEVDAYLESIDDRVATDGRAPTAARLFDSRLLLARAAAREQLALAASTGRRGATDGAPWSWVTAPDARDERARLEQVLGLLDAASMTGSPDAATREEIAVRQAFVQFRLGRHVEALSTLDGPSSADPIVGLWRELIRGRARSALDRLPEAAAAFEQAARLAPGAQTPAVALASTWLKLGDRQAAERWAGAARAATDAADPWTLYWTGDSRFLAAWLAELRDARP